MDRLASCRRVPALLVRLASIYFGVKILHHEVYEVETAEIAVIGVGLWLLGAPAAAWLDALRRAGLGETENPPKREPPK